MLFEGLMRHDESGNLDLGLAQSFSIDKSQLEYTFTLREAQWSDGGMITAYDVEYSWKRILQMNLHSANSNLMYFIKNAQKYVQNECDLSEVGIHAIDEKTLHVTLENPTPFFLEMLTVSIFKPIPSKIDEMYPNWDADISSELHCSGPFRVKTFKRGVGLILEKNPYYWDEEVVVLEEIELAYLPDCQTQAFLFKNGELDWFGQPLGIFDYDAYDNVGNPEPITQKAVYSSFWIQVNTNHPVLSNKNIRKALSFAINRQEIVHHVMQDHVKEAYTFLPTAFNLEKIPSIEGKTLDEAREAFKNGLEELGITKEAFPSIQLTYVSIGMNKKIAEVIQDQVKDILGVQLSLAQREWKVHLDSVTHGNFQLAELGWFSSYPDPSYFLYLFEDKDCKDNYSRWSNTKYTELIHKLKKEYNSQRRIELIVQLDQILTEEHPVIPIYNSTYSYAKNKHLKNVVLSEMGIIDFKYASLSNEEK